MTDIVFDVYGMNPIEIEIILMRDFDFHGFSEFGEGRFTVLCQKFWKTFTDYKIEFDFERIEKMKGKEENANTNIYSFSHILIRFLLYSLQKICDCEVEG